MHTPIEPHFVHLGWAVRRLTPAQAKYIELFYGHATLEDLRSIDATLAAAADSVTPPDAAA